MPPDPSSTILLIVTSLVASGFFSGMEMAFVSANRLQVEMDSDKGISGRLVSFFIQHPQLFIACMLVGNNLALVVCGIESGALISECLFGVDDWSSATNPVFALSVQTLITTLVILVTAEFIPKTIFLRAPTVWLNRLSLVLTVILAILAIPAIIIVPLVNYFYFRFQIN